MSVQVKGSGTIGGLDEGLVVSGIVTSSTQINVGSNIKLGSAGVCTATSFVGSGANLTGVLKNVVEDASPQLGANLDVNGANILFGDSSAAGTNLNRLKFGAGTDLHIWHNASTGNSNISNYNGDLYIQGNNGSGTGVNQIAIKSNATVELNYQGNKKLETTSLGAKISSSAAAELRITSADNSSGVLYLGPSSDYDATQIWYDDYSNGLYFRVSTNASMTFYTNATQRLVLQNDGHLRPYIADTYDLGTSSYRWRNVYTQDLQLSNEAKKDKGGNNVDGTWGDWTLQEGESNVYMINNRSGKKFKLKMEEV